VFVRRELTLGGACLIDELTAQAKSGRATLSITQLDQPALPCKHFGRQLAAVFAGHCPLDPLYDRRNRASIILKLLGAVLHRNADALTEIFVVCALVRILKPAPAADVVDKNGLEVGLASFDIPDELLKSVPASKF
jgi:hypothetical protein